MSNSTNNAAFTHLYRDAAKNRVEPVVVLYRQGTEPRLRIECRTTDKLQTVVEYENVKPSERVEDAAARIHKRLKKGKLV